ncbi:putative cysteine-rich receptor-like protein kinase 12 [Salvia splendens]|uniref:putative cysteine-rich receptor-like protein kinase 12 n=1 Tax=Salvia splendens TaxID=180675 RepID=UPI001C2804AD|nr:putative cysteine-rich receptor-like protein kinase 12 [Salvia splendens]
MITQNLLFLIYSSLLILSGSAHSFQTKCPPSSCGLVRNISYPFRLSTCRGPGYELVCENNVTLLYRKSRKYYVKEIDYQYHNIRLSAISTNDNICSLPSYPLDEDIFFSIMFPDFEHLIYLVRCEHPLHNSSLFTQLTDCEQSTKYTYIKLGNLTPNDIDNMCTIVSILTTSGCLQYLNNVSLDPISRCSQILNNASLSEIYQSLLYGFDMSWWSFMCSYCKGGTWGCSPISDGLVDCGHPLSQQYYKWVYILDSFRSPKGPTGGCLLILMLILAVVFGGLIIPLKIMVIIALGAYFWTQTTPFLLPGAQSIDELPRMVHLEKPYSLSEVTVVSMEVRFIMGFLGGMWFLIYKFRRRHLSAYEEIESFLQNDNHLSPIRYSYSEIKKMTRNFREKLGEGGFGSVYKGKLRSGHYVAVKLLGKAKIKDKDFINEIGTIGRIHHVNVVQLVGYCAERSKRVLILDFMPNGSLDKYILNPEKASSLDWDMKFKIAVGVARGIQYLHSGCDIKILHFDIKPHNILLDDKFVPKVSDFGLAKLCSVEKDTVTITAARGTIGYVTPELINRSIGLVSHKADVYSFGMLLMEMAGVNRELRENKDDSTKYFPDWIYDCINKGKGIVIGEAENTNIDNYNVIGKSVLEKMTIVGLWCIQMNPDNRPSMNTVLEMLEGYVEDLKIPEHPSHLVNEDKSRAADSTGSASQMDYDNGSVIEISIA